MFSERARSDAVIIGGHTVRRDNPKLTTRQDGGHIPIRIVMSGSLNLPEARGLMPEPPLRANAFGTQTAQLWDVSVAPTIVMVRPAALAQLPLLTLDRRGEACDPNFRRVPERQLGLARLTPPLPADIPDPKGRRGSGV